MDKNTDKDKRNDAANTISGINNVIRIYPRKISTIAEEPSDIVLSNYISKMNSPIHNNQNISKVEGSEISSIKDNLNEATKFTKNNFENITKLNNSRNKNRDSIYKEEDVKSYGSKINLKDKNVEKDSSVLSNEQKLEDIQDNFSFSDIKNDNYDYMEFCINDNEKNKEIKDNTISTTKYNVFTFLPKGLLIQFMRLANVYFLFTAIIQSIPLISPLSSVTAIVPLIFVLGISMIRELIEDLKRQNYDKLNNDEEVIVYRNGQFTKSKSRSLRCGEIVLVYEKKSIPADMVLIDSGMKEGVCYLETSSLDGEKTLKLKVASQKIYGIFSSLISSSKRIERNKKLMNFNMMGLIQVDQPNENLNQIDGKLEYYIKINGQEKQEDFQITSKEFLLKGSILKNTNYIFGIVIYTGMNNKIILNSKKPTTKISLIEKNMNICLIGIFCVLIALCGLCSYYNSVQSKRYKKYLKIFILSKQSDKTNSIISFFTYFLLLNTFIPISLIITLEIIKIIQGVFIEWDIKLYSKLRHSFCKAKTVSINEELGNVNFIFSDKTGTLTMNQLELKFCIIQNKRYQYVPPLHRFKNRKKSVNSYEKTNGSIKFSDDFFYNYIYEKEKLIIDCQENGSNLNSSIFNDDNIQKEIFGINEFWKALSLANQCMITEEKGEIKYIGTSPDDLELLKSASKQGYKLVDITVGKRVLKIGKKEITIDVLNVLGFSSDRKRMSIIIRESNGKIKMYTKGADSEIIKRLSKESKNGPYFKKICDDIEFFSRKGFRTLMVTYKEIKEDDYNKWIKKLHKDELNFNKKNKIEKCYEYIENKLQLIGATIMEDKLQDKVPETIKDLLEAGIKIWVLTGDKMDTSENIGLSCKLINKNNKMFKLCALDDDIERVQDDPNKEISKFFDDFQAYLEKLQEKYEIELLNRSGNDNGKKSKKSANSDSENNSKINWEVFKILKSKGYLEPFSIIVEAPILCGLFKDEELTESFIKIGYNSTSVLCCRVSPFQKSQIVQKIKQFDKNAITLAIGDGGNDVSMIMEAHIGIGIYGEEGMSAAQASDFSIGEFKLLKRLLFVHGRYNLLRISKMILYFFYKNFIFTICQLFYCPLCLSSGQTIIDDWYITCYNLIFTALPVIVASTTDYDIKEEDGIKVKGILSILYKDTRDINRPFIIKNFCINLLKGVLLNIFMVYIIIKTNIISIKGNAGDLWHISLKYYLSIIICATSHLFMLLQNITLLLIIVVFINTFFLLAVFLLLVHYGLIFQFNSKASIFYSFSSLSFYMNIFLFGSFLFLFDYLWKSILTLFTNNLSYKMGKYINNKKQLPKRISKQVDINQEGVLNQKSKNYKKYNINLNNHNDVSKVSLINKISVTNNLSLNNNILNPIYK